MIEDPYTSTAIIARERENQPQRWGDR